MKSAKITFLLCAYALILLGCEKECEHGPQEIQVSYDTTGMVSFIDTVYASEWIGSPGWSYRTDLTSPLITSDVVDNGVVLVQYRVNSTWSPIPGTYDDTYSFQYWLNTVQLVCYNGGSPPGGSQKIFKVTIIS